MSTKYDVISSGGKLSYVTEYAHMYIYIYVLVWFVRAYSMTVVGIYYGLYVCTSDLVYGALGAEYYLLLYVQHSSST